MCGGALVELGADPSPLLDPLLREFERSLAATERLRELGATLFPEDGDERLREMTEETLLALFDQGFEGLDAHSSLRVWHCSFAAVLSRMPEGLERARQTPGIAGAVERLRAVAPELSFAHALLRVLRDEALIVLFPEVEQGYRVELSGVVDMGQLTILLSDPLKKAFRSVGANGRAAGPVLEAARGEGPQESGGEYSANIHFYPWPAMNPATGLPEPDRAEWLASSGRGAHSLPPDFLPADLPMLDGTRVLLAVGPRVPGDRTLRFSRGLPGYRIFDALKARLAATGLPRGEVLRWLARIKEAQGR